MQELSWSWKVTGVFSCYFLSYLTHSIFFLGKRLIVWKLLLRKRGNTGLREEREMGQAPSGAFVRLWMWQISFTRRTFWPGLLTVRAQKVSYWSCELVSPCEARGALGQLTVWMGYWVKMVILYAVLFPLKGSRDLRKPPRAPLLG